VALVRNGAFQRRVSVASEGLQPHLVPEVRHADVRTRAEGRVLLVQNDAARVAETSLIGWPDTVSSLISVPVLRGGRVEGAIEVVDVRGRRSTEWEIALIQVVAARAAGQAHDQAYADADAVA
jgi:GAF domain-containing protein